MKKTGGVEPPARRTLEASTDELISLYEARRRRRVEIPTLRRWLEYGLLTERGHGAAGGQRRPARVISLSELDELLEWLAKSVTTTEAAAIAGAGRDLIARLCDEDELPCRYFGSKRRIEREAVERLAAQRASIPHGSDVVSLKEAKKQRRCGADLHKWIKWGHLTELGRGATGGPHGPARLISLRELDELLEWLAKSVTSRQAEAILGVSHILIDKLCEGGELPCRYFGRDRRVEGEAVERFAAERAALVSMAEITRTYGLQYSQLMRYADSGALTFRRASELGAVHTRPGPDDAWLVTRTELEAFFDTLPPSCAECGKRVERGHVTHVGCAARWSWRHPQHHVAILRALVEGHRTRHGGIQMLGRHAHVFAAANDNKVGRPSEAEPWRDRILELRAQKKSYRAIARIVGLSKSQVERVLKAEPKVSRNPIS